MIASRKHNFIFIKTMKTAGTSIELVLSPHCGPQDILLPINQRFDLQRARDGVFPRNFGPPEIEERYVAALRAGDRRAAKVVLQESDSSILPAHSKGKRVREVVGREFWDSAYKFTSERHPYDKVLSLAGMTPDRDINEVVFKDRRYIGHQRYVENDKLMVDHVILYPRLAEDLLGVLARFDLPMPTELPRARYNERDRRPAKELLTVDQRAFIYEQCALEFELFGWER